LGCAETTTSTAVAAGVAPGAAVTVLIQGQNRAADAGARFRL